jgi:pimeloyl-ACP methyl ester carboxylesterase
MVMELFAANPLVEQRPTPILFIHGAWHGAWCWQEYFIPYFVRHGYSGAAINLPNHCGSPGRRSLRFTRMREYVQAVSNAVDSFPTPPILVGHSMGGFIMQHYLEIHTVPAAVLLASVPPAGVFCACLRTLRRIPWPFIKANLTMSLSPLVSTVERARDVLFTKSLPLAYVEPYFKKLQDESYLGFLDMLVLDRPKPQREHRWPLLVLGAEQDALFSPDEVRRTAEAYGTTAKSFNPMAHDMMLEPGWREVADYIFAWLRDQNL